MALMVGKIEAVDLTDTPISCPFRSNDVSFS